jgi:tetratricopeptide (TPR) repeat protein
LQPFVDLEPCERGPLYAVGLQQYWAAFVQPERPAFILQRALPWPFRGQVLREFGLQQYQVDDPRDLPSSLQNERWRAVCEALDRWPELTIKQQCRLVLLLHALCFYPLVTNLIPPLPRNANSVDPDRAELAFWGASARYILGLPDRVADYGHADLSEFENVLASSPDDQQTGFNAAIKIFVHKAKIGKPAEEIAAERTRAERALETALVKQDAFTRDLLTSRFYRSAGFVPQLFGDRAEVVRLMDLAERHALAMRPADKAQDLLYLENLHPVLESRTKEAIWLGDLDLALARALRVVELDPYDSKSWLELGQVRRKRKELGAAAEAYAFAAVLGPPASAIARHMAGVCFGELDQPLLAAFFLNSALDIDPLAMSAHEQIQALPDLPAIATLKEWSLRSFDF